jgi:Tfp pilus assembly protein PilE
MIKKNKTKCGYAILELLFYIAFFSILSLVVINAMLTMARSFKETSIQEQLVQSGTIMERISREIRTAYNIDTTSTNTDLKLDTNSGTNNKIEFRLLGVDLQLFENETLVGNLNSPNIIVTNISFSQITTIKGKAIKIILTVKSTNDTLGRTQDFYDTVVLRGSY